MTSTTKFERPFTLWATGTELGFSRDGSIVFSADAPNIKPGVYTQLLPGGKRRLVKVSVDQSDFGTLVQTQVKGRWSARSTRIDPRTIERGEVLT